jgi:hypothetical protein
VKKFWKNLRFWRRRKSDVGGRQDESKFIELTPSEVAAEDELERARLRQQRGEAAAEEEQKRFNFEFIAPVTQYYVGC